MEVYARVRRAVQVDGMSIRHAAREFGPSRKSIRKMLQFSLPPGIGRKLTANSGIDLDTKLEGQAYALAEQCEANLLRIAQEAMTNAVRHSGAQCIGIRLAYQTGSVVLEIGDSGRGMSGGEPSGFGVDGMRERSRQIGGEIKILSDPGRGTRIVVTVPGA
jgi:signal transduction histidine kinase